MFGSERLYPGEGFGTVVGPPFTPGPPSGERSGALRGTEIGKQQKDEREKADEGSACRRSAWHEWKVLASGYTR